VETPLRSLWIEGSVRPLEEEGTHKSASQIIATRRRTHRFFKVEDDLNTAHPAKQSLSGDPIGQSRVEEYQVLASEAFGKHLSDENIRVTRLSQVFSTLP
jgi:hypothetical protein